MSAMRGCSWSITINNPKSADDENIQRARQRGWKVVGQKELGENGTPHYQLMLKTPQVRFSAIKKAFPRAHIELARNVEALETYVQKEDTRVGNLQETNEMYPSLTKLWDLFYQYITTIGDYTISTFPRNEDRRLEIFDEFVETYIEQMYHIETMAVNPQIRSCVKKYISAIFLRCEKQRVLISIARQVSQTDGNNVEVDSIKEDASENSESSASSYDEGEESETEY